MGSETVKAINAELTQNCIKLIEKPWEAGLLHRNVFALVWDLQCKSIPEDQQESLWTQTLQWVQKEMRAFKPCLLVARTPTLNCAASWAMENAGFHLMECYLELEHRLEQIASPMSESVIRPFFQDEIPKLESIARESFRHSRFHMDSQITPDEASLTRSEWVKNACLGRAEIVLVAEVKAQPVGFVIGMRKTSRGEALGKLDLIAVHPDYRNRKLGYDLTVTFLEYCRSQKYRLVRVGTQAHNIPSLRMYEKAGFLMNETFYSFHKHLI